MAMRHILVRRSGKVSGKQMWGMHQGFGREKLRRYLQAVDDMHCRDMKFQKADSKAFRC